MSSWAGFASPASVAVPATPSGTDVTLPDGIRGLYIGTGGDVKVTMKTQGVVTFANVPSGTLLPIFATTIFNTGTTAAGIIALK